MPFIKTLNKDFVIKDNHFELSENYKKIFHPKKITGTRLFSIVGNSKYNSPFKQWCILVGIYSEPMDATLAKLGIYIEPKVRDYVSKKFNVKYKDYVPAEVKWNVFDGKTDPGYEMFGGIPDGEPINDKGELDYSNGNLMLEVKTSSIDAFVYKTEKGLLHMQKDSYGLPLIKEPGKKKLSWFNENGQLKISKEYMYQLGLYLYLRKIESGMFAVCFLTAEDYAHPENFVIETHEVYFKKMALTNREQFKTQVLDKAKDWYNSFVKTGISPEMTEADRQWLHEVELI